MRAIDTNVLIRLLVRDDPGQAKAAEAFVQSGAWVSWLVLMEAAWVLSSVYGLTRTQIGAAMRMLLQQSTLSIQDADGLARALAQLEAHPKVSLTDCLILEAARGTGHGPLGTFDRALAQMDGAQKL